MNIAILVASGCVGRTLAARLLKNSSHVITASYQKDSELFGMPEAERVLWKKVNLLAEQSARDFLKGAEVMVYLIHSLHRKDFKDFDPKIARSAVVAAKAAGVKKIIYLGGIKIG